MRNDRRLSLLFAAALLISGCTDHGNGGSGGGGGTFTITTTAAPFGVVGSNYSATMATAGGTAPFTWSLFGGSLPLGLNPINPATGAVTGIPTADGNSTVTFIVRDSTNKTATGSVLFAVHTRTDRVSVDGSGTAGNGASSSPSISEDGSLVAFASQATNLVTGVSGSQIYVHNRQTNQVEVVSRNSTVSVIQGDGISSAPAISSDGRFVAFVSQSTNLVPGVSGGQHVYLRDRQIGKTTLVSSSSSGVISNGTVNGAPSINSDGQFIAFTSNATNLVSGVNNGQQIFLRDNIAGTTTLISKDNNSVPSPGNAASDHAWVSSDGRFIAFASLATNLVVVIGSNQQIFIHDRLAGPNGTTTLISRDSGGAAANGNSSTPFVSGDGRFVTFASVATNLVAGPTGQQIYLHDRNTGVNGTNSLVSQNNSGVPTQGGNGASSVPSISLNGQVVTFVSLSTDLLSGISGQQVYSRDLATGTTNLVSRDNNLVLIPGSGVSTSPSASSDGSFVAFSSQSNNLVPVPPVAPSDIYVRALP
jgi:Tol biopolymer transport system component